MKGRKPTLTAALPCCCPLRWHTADRNTYIRNVLNRKHLRKVLTRSLKAENASQASVQTYTQEEHPLGLQDRTLWVRLETHMVNPEGAPAVTPPRPCGDDRLAAMFTRNSPHVHHCRQPEHTPQAPLTDTKKALQYPLEQCNENQRQAPPCPDPDPKCPAQEAPGAAGGVLGARHPHSAHGREQRWEVSGGGLEQKAPPGPSSLGNLFGEFKPQDGTQAGKAGDVGLGRREGPALVRSLQGDRSPFQGPHAPDHPGSSDVWKSPKALFKLTPCGEGASVTHVSGISPQPYQKGNAS
ncbi:hypothetical protein CB1_000273039 [Camelus ferus]|nr:hypothetical protein CB1_000273039 [Camelus ferus]